MSTARPRTLTAALMVTVLLVLVGCSKTSDNAAPSGTTAAPTSSSTLLATSAADGSPNCTPEVLTPVVQAKYAGAVLAHLACDGPYAVTTVRQGAGLTGDGVAFLVFKGGAWTIVASGEVGASADALLPPDFSTTLFGSWKLKYNREVHPEAFTTTTPKAGSPAAGGSGAGSGGGGSASGGSGGGSGGDPTAVNSPGHCSKNDIPTDCTTTTPPPPPPPPGVSTPPPSVVVTQTPQTQPGDPTPPTTSGSINGSTASAFCKAHPLDARCLANPGFPG